MQDREYGRLSGGKQTRQYGSVKLRRAALSGLAELGPRWEFHLKRRSFAPASTPPRSGHRASLRSAWRWRGRDPCRLVSVKDQPIEPSVSGITISGEEHMHPIAFVIDVLFSFYATPRFWFWVCMAFIA